MTTAEALLAVSSYPVPYRTIEAIALKRGLSLTDEADQSLVSGKSYQLSLADLYIWLYFAPNVSQGGQSYSFTAEQRSYWKSQALKIYNKYDEDAAESVAGNYGYMGAKF